MHALKIFFMVSLLLISTASVAVEKVRSEVLKPDDSEFMDINDEFKEQGVVKKIITSKTTVGFYHFVFVEKPIRKEEYSRRVVTDYGVKANGEWGEIKSEKEVDNVVTVKNLRAYILLSNHGGYNKIQSLRDDGNIVYWPEFVYRDCFVDDADGDGNPEFYLTYYGGSDGLDAKPLKIIVYNSSVRVGEGFLKAKMTAFYPAGNEDDKYRVEYNEAWLTLPDAIKARTKNILESYNSDLVSVTPY